MPETPTPPGPSPQPPPAPRGFRSPEARLASVVLRLVAILRSYPHAFPVKYDELKLGFWKDLSRANRLDVFASDFFDDLLEVANHPLAALGRKPEHEARLREVALLGALRRLQAGDLQDGIARARRVAGVDAEAPIAWPQGTERDAVLTPAVLRQLAVSLSTAEPATAAVLEELVPRLERDPTSISGPAVGMLVHLTSVDLRLHTGYGLWMTLRCRAEVTDRRGSSTFSLNRRVLEADSPLQKALAAADGVSRSSRGPRLDRGLQLHINAEGLEEFVTGESADLTFALLFASEGRSAASPRRLLPHPGSAAIGEVTADGLVREVAAGPLRSKLRRVWESGVRRLYVAAGQEAQCRDIFATFGGRDVGLPADVQPLPPAAGDFEPADNSHAAFARWVGVIPAGRLEDVALPHHFVVDNRRFVDWARRSVLRNRLESEAAAAILAAVLVVLGFLYLPSNPTSIAVVPEDTIRATYTRVKADTEKIKPKYGHLRILKPDSIQVMSNPALANQNYCWLGDVTGNRKNEVMAVCLVTNQPNADTGVVRIVCLSHSLEELWGRDVLPDIRFGSTIEATAVGEWKVAQASFEDWNGDGRKDVIIAMTNQQNPSVVAVYDGNGNRLVQYVHAGHVKSYCLARAGFVLADSCQAPPSFSGDWRQRQCLVGLAYHAASDSGTILFAIPPWADSVSVPPVLPDLRHVTLPACGGPYVNIPPSLIAERIGSGRTFPDRVEYVSTPREYLRAGTLEKSREWPREYGKPGITLIREFGPQLVQQRVNGTKELFDAMRGTIPRDDAELARSIETLRYWEHGHWVWRRVAAW